jgi:LPXTG-motif cell wall-anchored protein
MKKLKYAVATSIGLLGFALNDAAVHAKYPVQEESLGATLPKTGSSSLSVLLVGAAIVGIGAAVAAVRKIATR